MKCKWDKNLLERKASISLGSFKGLAAEPLSSSKGIITPPASPILPIAVCALLTPLTDIS